MSLSLFYADDAGSGAKALVLDEENSRHIVQVLRMTEGDRLLLTDGKGNTSEAVISAAHKKHCAVDIVTTSHSPRPEPRLTIAISLLKNQSRFEWFLEKATELGTAAIIPLICERTGKQKVRTDRLVSICRNAMLQSSQSWLPEISDPQKFPDVVQNAIHHQKFIAHCLAENRVSLASAFNSSLPSQIVLIGPEGDFTASEITLAESHHFRSVSLGNTRLRTETAGLYAAVTCRPH